MAQVAAASRATDHPLARPLRIEFPGGVYHITSRGNGREAIFLTEADRVLFLELLGQAIDRFQWVCHAYCLMSNHLAIQEG